jgi:predicted transcriptional regulator
LRRDLKNVRQDLRLLSEVGLVIFKETETDKRRIMPEVNYAKILLEIQV